MIPTDIFTTELDVEAILAMNPPQVSSREYLVVYMLF